MNFALVAERHCIDDADRYREVVTCRRISLTKIFSRIVDTSESESSARLFGSGEIARGATGAARDVGIV